MQLKKRRRGRLWRSLGVVTANLFMATHGMAQSVNSQYPMQSSDSGNLMNEPSNDLGTAAFDSAILFYQEEEGRVRAIEPVVNLRITRENKDVFSARFTYDSLTGASPNGAAPWKDNQVFTTPAPPPSQDVAVTSASGHKTIVTIPGTGTRVAQYTIAPHTLPVDAGFRDRRYALDMSYDFSWDSNTNTTVGFGWSDELDYTSYSVNGDFSRAFNNKNTTLSLGVNYEYDKSKPLFGTPTPFTEMNGLQKGGSDSKTVTSLNAGIAQVMSRFWLLQLHYDIGWNKGYQNDPYKIVSMVDATSGMPLKYLYESRPDSRTRQSIYLGNKIALGPTVAEIDARYYHDSWGIHSITGDVSLQIPLWRHFYIQPEYHYYRQSAANFFRYYLLDGEAPQYASADGRLAKFNARTYGVKLGYELSRNSELYLMAEDYKQSGVSHLAGAPGDLANENFFSGVHARSIMLGFSYKFQM